MTAFLLYNLKSGCCLVLFYLFFKLLMSRETLHRLNRIVLLAGVVLAFAMPSCVVTIYREGPAPAAEEAAPAPQADAWQLPRAAVAPEPAGSGFPWEYALAAAFWIGAAATLARMLCSIAGVMRTIGRGRCEPLGEGIILSRHGEPVSPFSWLHWIVISDADYAACGAEIIAHERAHIRLRHSVDLLATDLLSCLQWFNPAMWLLRRELRAIHEYEADEAVLRSGIDARRYQLLLIRKAAGGRWCSVANSFNHSKLKNRIAMMLQEKSSRWAGAKALFLLPLLGLALGAFAETVYLPCEGGVSGDPEHPEFRGGEVAPVGAAEAACASGECPDTVGTIRLRPVSGDACRETTGVVCTYGETPDTVGTIRLRPAGGDARRETTGVVCIYGETPDTVGTIRLRPASSDVRRETTGVVCTYGETPDTVGTIRVRPVSGDAHRMTSD